jgi:hypothetical protein
MVFVDGHSLAIQRVNHIRDYLWPCLVHIMSKGFTEFNSCNAYPTQPTIDEDFVPLACEHRAVLVPSLFHEPAKKVEGVEAVLNGKQQSFQSKLSLIYSTNSCVYYLFTSSNMPNREESKYLRYFDRLAHVVRQNTLGILSNLSNMV